MILMSKISTGFAGIRTLISGTENRGTNHGVQ